VSDDLSIPNPAYRGNQAGRYGTGQGRVTTGMDPDTRRLVIFAGGLGIVLLGLIGASAFVGRHGNEVPVVAADARPVKEKPLHPGGMKIDGAENDVFSAAAETGNGKLSAASETPDTNALSAAATAPPPVAEAPAQAPVVHPTAAASPAGKPTVVAAAPPVAKPTVVAANTAPAAKPALAKSPVAAAETHAGASGHPAMVQLAAASSEEAAHTEWKQLSKRMPDLLNGRQPSYQRIERDGRVFWRLRTAGFGDVGQAKSFCDHVRAKGGGCSVADF
jgi:hypothetical protein